MRSGLRRMGRNPDRKEDGAPIFTEVVIPRAFPAARGHPCLRGIACGMQRFGVWRPEARDDGEAPRTSRAGIAATRNHAPNAGGDAPRNAGNGLRGAADSKAGPE